MKKASLLLVICLFIATSAWAVSGYPNKARVKNETLASTASEYQVAIPNGTGYLQIQSRTANDLLVAFSSGETSTNYFTIKSGTKFEAGPLALDSATPNTTLFFKPGTNGQVVEIIFWQ